MTGRPKLPKEIKQLKGTYQPCRDIPNAMSPDKIIDLPYPPDYLNDNAKKEWYNVVREFQKMKMLTNLDLPMLASYCNEYSIYIEMNQKCVENGRIDIFYNIDGSTKYTQQSAYQKVANDAFAKALKIATEFGFTPASRTKVSMGNLAEDEDPFLQMLKFK